MIIVLADDLSGAAEIAGVAFQKGLSAEVHIDQLYATGCDVAVVDTNSRSVVADMAVQLVSNVAQKVVDAHPQWVYKKTDSVLRGHVLAELTVLCDALGHQRCLLVNANPRKGRIVRDGQLWVDGRPVHQTPFGTDPEHPCRSSSVIELLGGLRDRVQVVNSGHELPDVGTMVGNAVSTDDLRRYADWSCPNSLPQKNILLAGGAEFFEAVLETTMSDQSANQRHESKLGRELGYKRLIVSGTSTAAANEYANKVLEVDDDSQATAIKICRILENENVATLSAAQQTPNATDPIGTGLDPDSLQERLVETVLAVDALCSPHQLWIEGGRTASSIVRAFGWQRLMVNAVYGDGVVGLRSTFPLATTVVVKPGSYRWPATAK